MNANLQQKRWFAGRGLIRTFSTKFPTSEAHESRRDRLKIPGPSATFGR
jgi:hypothetical protein